MIQPTSAEHQNTSDRPAFEVEDVPVRPRHLRQVAAGGVQDALRLGRRPATCTGRTADARRRASSASHSASAPGHRLVEEHVLVGHRAVDARRGAPRCHGRSGIAPSTACLDRRRPALAPRAVDGDQRLGVGELHALRDRLRRRTRRRRRCAARRCARTPASPRRPRGSSAGRSRRRRPAPTPAAFSDVGEPLDVAMQLGVGDVTLLALLAAPVEGHAVADARPPRDGPGSCRDALIRPPTNHL